MSVTPSQFAEAVLTRIKGPNGETIHATANNVNAMLAWMKFEGGGEFNPGSPFHFNPLNTTQAMPGSHSPGGPAGVQSYPDWKTGLDATVKTLGYGFYQGIRASLAANNPPEVTLAAVKASPWGTTAIDPNAWPTLVAQIKGAKSSGSLGFPWVKAAIVTALVGGGIVLITRK